ncbi:MAG: hypothetical protein R2828_02845 [Saprospiraceae bacterium]
MKKNKIKVSIVSNELSPAVKEEMWDVYSKYYDYSKAYFMERMEKNNFFSLYTVEGKIVGFTGLRINRTTINGKKRLLIYFGQTIIDSNYRGKSLIPTTGAKLCLKYLPEILSAKTYFWADCLTYKAYLVFAKTLENYYPSYKNDQVDDEKAVVDYIGQTHYPDTYCPKTGTVLKDSVVVTDTTTMQLPFKYHQDKDINFYTKANPFFEKGNGLITLGPVNFANFTILLKRMLRKTIGSIPQRAPQPIFATT